MVGDELVLTAMEVVGRGRWRWLLTDEDGAPLADHPVAVDETSTEMSAFTDFYRFLRWNAAPDRRVADAAAWVDRIGEWAGREVLGELLGQRMVKRAPTTVRVVLPVEAEHLALWPWELAWAQGRPLAWHRVSLVFETGAVSTVAKQPVRDALRMLAVFSLPTAQSALGLRRERYALTRLVRQLSGRWAVELQVLQYGATRERLAELVETGDGWDLVHLSGHGGVGELALEHSDGSPDPVTTDELVELLRPARRRVKLAVVSACESAAATTAETLRLLGATGPAEELEVQAKAEVAAGGVNAGLARGLAEELGCAVLAMRYPVADDFAIDLASELYKGLFRRKQSVDVALGQALPRAAGQASVTRPALSLGTPTLIGASAVGLKLPLPQARPAPDDLRMAEFPAEPERFVGRAGPMARASAVLAVDTPTVAVMFHGMAGAGKTTCAVELAYRHVDGFAAAVFWQAPTNPDLFNGALGSLASSLETQLAGYGLAIVDKISPVGRWERFLPQLAELAERNRLLIVLDNLETLLTPEGAWRDPRWGPLVDTLAGHRGESRLVLTSRTRPADLGPHQVLTLPVHALSRDETVLLARELPGLRALLHTDSPAERRHDDPNAYPARAETDRRLARRVLDLVQGHPKLLELADAAAVDPDALAVHLAVAGTAAHDRGLEAFFTHGDTTFDPEEFLDVLASWTSSTVATLPNPSRLLFQILCAVEERDRISYVLEDNWADLWRRMDRSSDPPAVAAALAPLVTAALVQTEPVGDVDDPLIGYRIHPGVAAVALSNADPEIRIAVDHELAVYWSVISQQAREQEGGEAGQAVVRAGLAGAPYLLRLAAYDQASTLLEYALYRDNSPAVVQAALPFLRRIAHDTGAPKDLGVLARALRTVDVVEAEQLLRGTLAMASERQNHRLASAASGELVTLLQVTGRLPEALKMANIHADHIRAASMGPWTRLSGQARRLRILVAQGKHEQVLTDLQPLLLEIDALPNHPTDTEQVDAWNVQETLLDIGREAALDSGLWEQSLAYSTAIHASQVRRNAGAHALAHSQFNSTLPLIRFDQIDGAEQILRGCHQAFIDFDDMPALAMVLSTQATLESRRRRHELAIELERTALRIKYLRPNPGDIAVSHHNLANYLHWVNDRQGACAHRIAAALIYQLTGQHEGTTLEALALDLHLLGSRTAPPTTLGELADIVDQVDGVFFAPLITRLCPDTATADTTIATLITTAPVNHQQLATRFDQWIAMVIAAARGDQKTVTALEPLLDQMASADDWAALAEAWRRILAGERGADTLTADLGEVHAAIVTRTLDALTGQEPA